MFWNLLYPRPYLLVSSCFNERTNVTAVEWSMPVSQKPPMIAVALTNNGLSLDLISHSKEFVVAVPTERIREAVELCASTSGKFLDKFSESKLTPLKATKVSAPLILEAAANYECIAISYVNYSMDHTIVFGEVVQSHVPEDKKTGEDKKTDALASLLAKVPGAHAMPQASEKRKKEPRE